MPAQGSVKEVARRLVDQLPDDATWDDFLYQVYVHQSIEAGRKDGQEGRTIPVSEVRKRLGLRT
jgi:hypothetical protein